MMDCNRRRMLLLAGLCLAALVLLSAGLSGLELLPGRPVPAQMGESGELVSPGGIELINTILAVLGLITVLLLPLVVVALLTMADRRKRLLYGLLLLLWLAGLFLMVRDTRPPPPGAQALPTPTPPAPTAEVQLGPSAGEAIETIEIDVRPPAWLVWLGAGVLALVALGVVAGAAWLFWPRRPLPPVALEELAREAEAALAALRGGAGVAGTVLHCYYEMSRILAEERGLERGEAMTPREFESRILAAGLPAGPTARLTRLFEAARYGAGQPGAPEESEATACLAAIVEACRSGP